jgi:vacuolar-type H+-ATPase subunit E/Vma4
MSVDDGTSRILTGITDDAKNEAEKSIVEARKMAEERITLARGKADGIRKEAKNRAAAQAERTRASVLSGLAVERKRELMKIQDEILRDLLERVRNAIGEAIGGKEYPSVLSRLITEAAIGLDTSAMTVNASAEERGMVNDTMLADITSAVAKACGHPVTITLSADPPLNDRGVVVTAANGRTAFNNLFSTRMRRFEQEIRNRVYDTLFSASASENAQTTTDQS